MENTINGLIIKGVGGLYSVKLMDNDSPLFGRVIPCRARGSFRHNNMSPLPGDKVLLMSDSEGESESGYVIHKIIQRKNSLIRPPLANLDYIFVTMAAAHPAPILTTVDKLTAIAEFNKIEPLIVITKSDLSESEAERIGDIYRQADFTVFTVSSVSGKGVDEIKKFILENMKNSIAAFAGASGIGKSTLMNEIFPSLGLSTSEISRKIERGRHTTRQVELFPISDRTDTGYIADTPGFSMLDFERFNFFDIDDLPLTMREFLPRIGQCRYTKCSHTKEDGCAILEAVRNGEIPASRHESFLELYATLKAKKKW